jgi:hypothetical protein
MTYMLCHHVADFEKWKQVFDSYTAAHPEAGMHITQLWHSLDDPRDVFFVLEVGTVERALAFIDSCDPTDAPVASAVRNGEYYFVESEKAYCG